MLRERFVMTDLSVVDVEEAASEALHVLIIEDFVGVGIKDAGPFGRRLA